MKVALLIPIMLVAPKVQTHKKEDLQEPIHQNCKSTTEPNLIFITMEALASALS